MTNKHIELPALSNQAVGAGPNPYYEGRFEGETEELATLRRSMAAKIDQLYASQQRVLAEQARVVGEPVAHVAGDDVKRYLQWANVAAFDFPVGTPVYAAPQEAQAVPVGQVTDPGSSEDKPSVKWFARLERGAHLYADPVAQPATEQAEAPSDKQIAMAMLAVDDPMAWGKLGAEDGKAMIKQFVAALFATQPTASNAGERELDLYDEIECDLLSLFGRASLEGHESGQRLAHQVRTKMQAARSALATEPVAPPAGEALTTGYVQTVPDKCDRIVWRNRYYHLPLSATTPAPAGQDKEDAERWRTASRSRHHGIVVFNQFGQGWVYDQKAVEVVDATRAARGDEVNQK